MAFVVPQVVRFSVNQQLGGRNIANVLDYLIEDPAIPLDRATTCELQASAIIDAWVDHIMGFQVNNLSAVNVSWVDLDDANGSTGVTTGSGAQTFPDVGVSTADPFPAQVAVLIHKNTVGSSRGQRRGRMYLAGMTEAANTADSASAVDGGLISGMNGALAAFLTDTTGTVATFPVQMVVTHILTRATSEDPNKLGAPLTGNSTEVATLTVDPVFATQRRRLR